MTPERWRHIEALFAQVLELPETERSGFLDGSCAGDPELRDELGSLLASSDGADASLRGAVMAEARRLASTAATAQLGRRIGPFRLVALLGEGGMGAVYLAERDDAQFAQRVAIKFLPCSIGSPQAIARFRDERQILAALDHPNIVHLLDGGNTEHDMPYLVMEYIEGTAITRYADAQGLSVRARVALARRVCGALQYAHQNLVVHRDIKPSNVLVDATGEPRILDFGIAKLLAPTAGFEREARTRTGLMMFTPEYASPEQARGEAVSTATDVYSLGAVLYELVSGQPPHRPTGHALEIVRVINEVDPPRPSAVAPAAVRRELVGDLDNIILKALHKEPARRYASMEQLSDDLGRFLSELPVSARTATVRYRMRKFVRRHKAVVLAAALVAGALLAATVVSLRQARRADAQAERAEAERQKAVEAAAREHAETERARKAEAMVQAQLDKLQAEQAARAVAEAEARAKHSEAELSREQLQQALVQLQVVLEQLRSALAKARQEKLIAEQESRKAREAEARAEAAASAEKTTREEAEALLQKEKARAAQLEQESKKITNQLR